MIFDNIKELAKLLSEDFNHNKLNILEAYLKSDNTRLDKKLENISNMDLQIKNKYYVFRADLNQYAKLLILNIVPQKYRSKVELLDKISYSYLHGYLQKFSDVYNQLNKELLSFLRGKMYLILKDFLDIDIKVLQSFADEIYYTLPVDCEIDNREFSIDFFGLSFPFKVKRQFFILKNSIYFISVERDVNNMYYFRKSNHPIFNVVDANDININYFLDFTSTVNENTYTLNQLIEDLYEKNDFYRFKSDFIVKNLLQIKNM